MNGENLTGVRQTRWDPLLLQTRAVGARWTVDAWHERSSTTNLAIEGTHYRTKGLTLLLTLDTRSWRNNNPPS